MTSASCQPVPSARSAIADIGMLPPSHDAAEAFYRVVDTCYERRSLAITSNIHPVQTKPQISELQAFYFFRGM